MLRVDSLHAYMLTRLHAYTLTCMCVHVCTLICFNLLKHDCVSTCLRATPCSATLTHIDNHLTPCDTYLITISGRTSSSGVRHTFRFLVLKDASKTSCGRRKKDQDGPRRLAAFPSRYSPPPCRTRPPPRGTSPAAPSPRSQVHAHRRWPSPRHTTKKS